MEILFEDDWGSDEGKTGSTSGLEMRRSGFCQEPVCLPQAICLISLDTDILRMKEGFRTGDGADAFGSVIL